MCLTIEDGLLSLLTTLSFQYHPTRFADIMSEYELIPNEVMDDVHRLYETGKLTDHHLRCRTLQAVKDFILTNEIENVLQVVILIKRYMFIGIGIESNEKENVPQVVEVLEDNRVEAEFMKDYLSKLLCVRGKGMGLIYNVYSTTSTNSTSISISRVTNH